MRHYELRFVTERGRVLRGPMFNKDGYDKVADYVKKIDGSASVYLELGHHLFQVPEGALSRGYLEIKPVGLIYYLIRSWRTR